MKNSFILRAPSLRGCSLFQSHSLVLLTLSLATLACTSKKNLDSNNSSQTLSASQAQLTQTQLIARGKTIYLTQCIACHNTDPRKPGSLGPEVFGSSRELLEARILRAEYPPGYTPKRKSHQMPALPHLKNEIEALYQYLNSH